MDNPPSPDTGERHFVPCPVCKQYSHSIGGDQIAGAFNHFQTMFSHRGDGIPTQHVFDQQTRDAAQVLTSALSALKADVERLRSAVDRALDGLDSIAGDRTPEFFPETSYDIARRIAKDVRRRAALTEERG